MVFAPPRVGAPASQLGIGGLHIALLLLLPGMYLADIFYGGFRSYGINLPVSPGTVIRGGAVGICLAFLVFAPGKVRLSWLAYLLLLVLLVLPGIAASVTDNPGSGDLAFEIRMALKALFAPVVFVFFCYLFARWRPPYEVVLRYLEACYYMLGLSLLIMKIVNMDAATYGAYASGSKGVFGPQNDLSLTMGVTMVAAVFNNIVRINVLRMFFLVVATLGFVGIGTRVSLLLTFAIPCLVLAVTLFASARYVSGTKKLAILSLVGPIVLLSAFLAGSLAVQEASKYQYQVDKYEALAQGGHPRARLMAAGFNHLADRPVAKVWFGEGAGQYQEGVFQYWDSLRKDDKLEQRRITEVDWLDLYGHYGLLFTVLLCAPLLGILLWASFRFLWLRHPVDGLAAVGLAIYCIHSVLAGHALTAPMPSGPAAAYAACAVTLPLLLHREERS